MMDTYKVNELISDWDEVYKKGQLSLWILLAISDGRKYAQEITDFMSLATAGSFEVKEQSLYRALRRFKGMGLVQIFEEESPNSGPKRKYYSLTPEGEVVLGRFIELHIAPLAQPQVQRLITNAQRKARI